ncbi:hypothetical protein BC939DRAFT_233959 [Gamsiella multidivaricata]|uniref:uncharacterized protein n=1 Tax=Gamsiella multidivaricata TaxID=101098 RepID=UPI00221E95B5|nr:uncharacterized protein BC939DRAFT_233959 [Gamsiella multidivaricata]KAI7820414.1 hypothetical protein BC939DRAFT_233959 [Gamsiella multidivaricata]
MTTPVILLRKRGKKKKNGRPALYLVRQRGPSVQVAQEAWVRLRLNNPKRSLKLYEGAAAASRLRSLRPGSANMCDVEIARRVSRLSSGQGIGRRTKRRQRMSCCGCGTDCCLCCPGCPWFDVGVWSGQWGVKRGDGDGDGMRVWKDSREQNHTQNRVFPKMGLAPLPFEASARSRADIGATRSLAQPVLTNRKRADQKVLACSHGRITVNAVNKDRNKDPV